MEQEEKTSIFSTPAHLWDGIRQLPGRLELWENEVVFRFANFQQSHMNLIIPLHEIEKVEEFLVFDLARNGLKITGADGRCDLFVLDGAADFKKAVKMQQAKNAA